MPRRPATHDRSDSTIACRCGRLIHSPHQDFYCDRCSQRGRERHRRRTTRASAQRLLAQDLERAGRVSA